MGEGGGREKGGGGVASSGIVLLARYLLGMILASTFSAAYLLVPRYILSAALAVLLQYPDMRSSLAYVLLIFVLMLVPPALSRWALRAASPMLDYFDFESATIRDRIDAAFSGDIAFLFDSAMQVRRLKQNSSSTY